MNSTDHPLFKQRWQALFPCLVDPNAPDISMSLEEKLEDAALFILETPDLFIPLQEVVIAEMLKCQYFTQQHRDFLNEHNCPMPTQTNIRQWKDSYLMMKSSGEALKTYGTTQRFPIPYPLISLDKVVFDVVGSFIWTGLLLGIGETDKQNWLPPLVVTQFFVDINIIIGVMTVTAKGLRPIDVKLPLLLPLPSIPVSQNGI